MSSQPRAGWYPDHHAPEGHLRYWDGTAWTEERSVTSEHPAPTERPGREVGPVREWVERATAGVVVAAFVAAVAFVYQSGQDGAGERPAAGPEQRPVAAGPVAPEAGVTDGSGEVAPTPAGTPSVKPPRTYLVGKVLAADTVRLTNGARVRLVGVRVPSEETCTGREALAFLDRLADGQTVTLRKPGADRLPDGRLLRYVLLGDNDLGLRLIRQGLAVADDGAWVGEGQHPRRETYRRAEAEASTFPCAR